MAAKFSNIIIKTYRILRRPRVGDKKSNKKQFLKLSQTLSGYQKLSALAAKRLDHPESLMDGNFAAL